MNEVKFANYVETGELTTKIDLGDFIKCKTVLLHYFKKQWQLNVHKDFSPA